MPAVIFSGGESSLRELFAESKDPYELIGRVWLGNFQRQRKFKTVNPAIALKLIGFLRLRICFASRSRCCAQDDSR
jgi:hypothetical protein